MVQNMTFAQLKIFFINIISILYKATALNVHRLHADMVEAKELINATKNEVWICELLIFLISGLLLIRFIFCFLGLASNIIAIYPILTHSQPELLMPTIIVQVFDNVVLNIYELILGYGCLKYLYAESFAVFVIFASKLIIKTAIAVMVLNIFSDKHAELANHGISFADDNRNLERESSEEYLISNQLFREMSQSS